jgi:hypothetical protein
MSGLTEANVERLCDSLNQRIALALHANDRFSAGQLQGILSSIKNMQCENTKQPSRPDRVGDECWYAASNDPYKRGVLRAWLGGQYEGHAVAVEDMETNAIRYVDYISFATESPDKMACKPQD